MCKGTRMPFIISGKSLDHFESVGFPAMSLLFYELRFFIPADFYHFALFFWLQGLCYVDFVPKGTELR